MTSLQNDQNTDFFNNLGTEARRILVEHSNEIRYKPGEIIFHEGDTSRSIYILLSGTCEVLKQDEVVNHIRPEEVFGEIATLGEGKRTATIRAAEEAVVLELSGNGLQVVLSVYPDVLNSLIRKLADQASRMSDREAGIRKEQKALQDVEKSLLPDPALFNESTRFSIESRWQPLVYASGDYCDVISLGDERYLFVIGDVMGHGAMTSVTLATVRGELRALSSRESSPRSIITSLDGHLLKHGPHNIPITLLVALVDGNTLTARYCNAGHTEPMLYRDGRVELLAGIHGPMLGFGLSQESEYGEDTFNLCQGDRLLFFTDGLTEARKGPDPQKDMLGMEGLQGIYQDICRNQAGQVLDTVFLAVDGFRRGYEAKDDATGLLLYVN